MSDERATPEEMDEAFKLSAEFQRGWDAAKAEAAADASKETFDGWAQQGFLLEGDALWMAWHAGFQQGWTAKAKE